MIPFRRVILGLGCLLLAFRIAAPAEPPASARIEAVTLRPEGRGLLLEVRTSRPALPYAFETPSAARPELVIEWPEASSLLPPLTALGDERVPQAIVEPRPGGAIGVRLRVPIRGLHLAGLEQTDAGLRVRLEPDASRGGNSMDYELDVGDKITMSVFGHEDLNATLEVRPDGTVDFPLIGVLPVVGKSIEQVDTEITKILGRDFLVDPQINIELKESAKLWVTIMGEIRSPGRYALKRDMRIIDLLAESGGLNKDAGSQILVTRRDPGGGVRTILVARDRLFSEENVEANLPLERNDVVTIGSKDYYYIRGEVARPGPYYLESGTTVLKAIAIAGGLTQFGNRRQVELLRQGEKGLHEKTVVSLKSIEDGKIPDVPLRPDDTIIVLKKVF